MFLCLFQNLLMKKNRMIVSLAIQHNEYEKRLVFKEQWIRSVIDNIAEGVIVVDISGTLPLLMFQLVGFIFGNDPWMNRPFAEQLSSMMLADCSVVIFFRYTNLK